METIKFDFEPTESVKHVQWKDYMVVNGEEVYVHALIHNALGTSLKAIKDNKEVLIRIKPTDVIQLGKKA